MRPVAFTVPRQARERRGEVCQDAAGVFKGPAEAVVLTVADGVGSSPRSEIGAKLAVATFGRLLAARAPLTAEKVRATLTDAHREWRKQLERAAAPDSASKVAFAFAVIRPPDFVLGAVGDCFGFVTRGLPHGQESHLIIDSGRVPGQSPNLLLAHLGSPHWNEAFRFAILLDPSINGVMLSSDGLEPVAIREGRLQLPGQPEFGQTELKTEFTDWLLKKARTQDGPAIAADLASWNELMISTDDDLGAALATW